MDREQERGDKRGETITLVGSYSQRENSTNNERYTNDREVPPPANRVPSKAKANRFPDERLAGR